jgi:mRNA interferase MazF
MPSRGEIWLANLNPQYGTEPGKTRPVLVIQSQALLDAGHPSTYVIPLTTRLVPDSDPLRVRIQASGQVPCDSDLLMDQMRAIDNRRLVRGPLLRLQGAEMRRIGEALLEVLGIES